MRICLAVGTLELGGAETQAVGVALEMLRQGHDVSMIVLARADGPLAPLLSDAGVPVRALGFEGLQFRDSATHLRPWRPLVDLLQLLSVVGHLRRHRIEVLHAYLFWSYVLLLPLAWLARVPVRIAARRGLSNALPAYPLRSTLTSISTVLATAVVANAQAVADDAHEREGVPRSKLHVLPNAVNLPQHTGYPGVEPPVGVIIANLIYYKGHLDLVDALSGMAKPVLIRAFGEGPMRRSIEKAIAGAGLERYLILEGRVLGACSRYAEAQFAVLASRSEGMPNAVLEAMAAGLPVVATDVGGCRELVEHGVTGFLVPPGDPEAMRAALEKMVGDSDFRVAAGEEARRRAERRTWERSARDHTELYVQLLTSRRRP